jgi:hypothetical protein
MDKKAGFLTSEFWSQIAAFAVVVFLNYAKSAWGWDINAEELLGVLGLTAVYAGGRTLHKNSVVKHAAAVAAAQAAHPVPPAKK